MEFLSKLKSRSFGAVAVAGGISAFSDIFKPLAPISTWVMTISFAFIIVLLIIIFIFNKKNETIWVSMFFLCGLFIFSLLFFIYQQVNESNKSVGVIASNVKSINILQNNLGLIERNVKAVASNTDSINKKMDELKRETSKDPKKELANRGIEWTRERFLETITNGDLETLKLFVEGGFKTNLYAGANQNYFVSIISDIPEEEFNKIITYLFDKAYLTPNKAINIEAMMTMDNPGLRYSRIVNRTYTYYNHKIRISLRANRNANNVHSTPLLRVNLLTIAVWEGNLHRIKKLLKIGEDALFQGKLDFTNENSEIITPISEAKYLGRKEIYSFLLSQLNK